MRGRFSRDLSACAWPRPAAELLAEGTTRGELRGSRWRQTSRGFYVRASESAAPISTTQRILDAWVPASGRAIVTGWAAAFVAGVDLLDGIDPWTMAPLPVDLLVPTEAHPRDREGVRYIRTASARLDMIETSGLAVATMPRAAFDGIRYAGDLAEAVAFADACAHAGRLDLTELRQFVERWPNHLGVEQARQAANVADQAARSTWESRLRVCWMMDARLPRPEANKPVFSLDGKLLGIPDLLDEATGFASEFDGQDHRDRHRHHDDNIREERLEGAGLTMSRADSIDLRPRNRPALAIRLRDGYARALRRDRSSDRWTTTEPDWWAQEAGVKLTDDEKAAIFGDVGG